MNLYHVTVIREKYSTDRKYRANGYQVMAASGAEAVTKVRATLSTEPLHIKARWVYEDGICDREGVVFMDAKELTAWLDHAAVE